jgi:coenzyme PQQ synthesis protein D (PqqD)
MEQSSPLARRKSLIVKELPDETLVYDRESDRAHCLNSTAAHIWRHCNGRRTVSELTELMTKETGAPVSEEVVWLALDQLEKFKLLQRPVTRPPSFSRISRRQLVGLAAIALPAIISLTAPLNVQAQSCLGRNAPCPGAAPCCPGCTCQPPTFKCKGSC